MIDGNSFSPFAEYCKDFNNFNSMFAILSGLGNMSVNRLRQTWTRVPNRYLKIFRDLETVMDPSQNMKNYRTLASSSFSQSPMVSFFFSTASRVGPKHPPSGVKGDWDVRDAGGLRLPQTESRKDLFD